MKCPQCAHQHPAKEGMACSKCNYRFTFNPKSINNLNFTDNKFVRAIAKASGNGTYHFTDNQLYSAYASQQKATRIFVLVFSFFLLCAIAVYFNHPTAGVIFAIVSGIGIVGSLTLKPSVMAREQFAERIQQWKSSGKKIEGLLERPGLHKPPPTWPEVDIYDYGVERILIVQRDILVDLLVLNGQHAEQRMLVISQNGYPDYLQERANQLILQRADLPVFFLHDAETGKSRDENPPTLEAFEWLTAQPKNFVDLGFYAEDFRQLKQTANYDQSNSERSLPVDALLMGSLATGVGACMVSGHTFAEELAREASNQAGVSSDFG